MKSIKNGIYDNERSNPTIHSIPKDGMKYIVALTDDFDSPHAYNEVIALLSSATPMDDIVWNIASHGGFVNTLEMLLGWKAMSEAKQIHVLHSNSDSCASAFFLSPADQYIVGDNASMMIHEYQVGNQGTNSNVLKRVEHTAKQNERFIKETYSGFLNDDELENVLKGVEVYLGAEQIRTRLIKREELKAQQANIPEYQDLSEFTSEEIQ